MRNTGSVSVSLRHSGHRLGRFTGSSNPSNPQSRQVGGATCSWSLLDASERAMCWTWSRASGVRIPNARASPLADRASSRRRSAIRSRVVWSASRIPAVRSPPRNLFRAVYEKEYICRRRESTYGGCCARRWVRDAAVAAHPSSPEDAPPGRGGDCRRPHSRATRS